jgi:hypothetical protein
MITFFMHGPMVIAERARQVGYAGRVYHGDVVVQTIKDIPAEFKRPFLDGGPISVGEKPITRKRRFEHHERYYLVAFVHTSSLNFKRS